MDTKRFLLALAIVTITCLALMQITDAHSLVDLIRKATDPLLAGCTIAYLTNLIMAKIEHLILPRSHRPLAQKARRPLAILASFAILLTLASLVIVLVSSQLHNTLAALSKGAETAWSSITAFIDGMASKYEAFDSLGKIINRDEIANSAMSRFGGSDAIVNSALDVGDSLIRTATSLGLGAIFSVYLLMAKERVVKGAKTFSRSVLPPKWDARVQYAATVANESFSRFIVGQCAEAFILGSLCFAGMSILRLPHAFTVGLCVGATALIPLFGAWIGGGVGALIILPDSLEKACVFLVFLALLQTFENHVIYPRTMKHTMNVSTIWVIAAVIVGGAIGGIAGIVLAVPIVATGQELLRNWWKPERTDEAIRQCNQTAE